MTSILTEIIGLLGGGLATFAEKIGAGLNAFVTNLFVDSTGGTNTLSTFGSVVAIFGGVALAIGLSKWITSWVSTLGARK